MNTWIILVKIKHFTTERRVTVINKLQAVWKVNNIHQIKALIILQFYISL